MSTSSDRLNRLDKVALGAFFAVVVAFGGVVELRGAFLSRPMTDVQVYFRAAWAVRTGADPLTTPDDNNWHYCYPPLLAIALAPLADAPPGQDRAGLVPYAVSVGVWYCLSVLALAWAVHVLAGALEGWSAAPVPKYGRRWWRLRIFPVLACLPPVGLTLVRGQVNLMILALLCASLAAFLRGRGARAGGWLGLAVSVKIIPAFLAALPVVRGDRRALAGLAGGMVVGLGLVPLAVFGPERTVSFYSQLAAELGHGIGADQNGALADELTNLTATHSQSVLAVIHNSLYYDREIWLRPPQPSAGERALHYLICGSLTAVTLWAVRRRRHAPEATALGFGMLTALMILTSPVCHQHYFCLLIPLVMVLLAREFERLGAARVGPGLLAVLAVNCAGSALPLFEGLKFLREYGGPLTATLVVWAVALVELWRLPAVAAAPPRVLSRSAA